MALIDPDGLFSGKRLRNCSNEARLHWPYLFLAANGYARLEIDYFRIVSRAYHTFRPIPTEQELMGYVAEYVRSFLLFPYQAGGQLWGQFDTPSKYLPKYKTEKDKMSPSPPQQEYLEWSREYRNKGLLKSEPEFRKFRLYTRISSMSLLNEGFDG